MCRFIAVSMTLLMAVGTTWSAPTGIDILSQQHHVSGSAGSETQFLPGGMKATYDEISSDPLDVSATGTYIDPFLGEVPLTARSRAGHFRVQADAVYCNDRRRNAREFPGRRKGGDAVHEPTDKFDEAIQMIKKARHVLLATVDETGTPRLTPVEECTQAGEGRISIRAWIELPPLEDRGGRSRMALLLLDEQGRGYQLIGHTLRALDTAVLDGLAEIEEQTHFPQVERDILMQVESVEDFHIAGAPLPHA